MKATLCVFVALVAVTSAAPAFMQSNRRNPPACTNNKFCDPTCTCANNGNGDCNAVTKYCSGGTVSSKTACSNTDGTAVVDANCECGKAGVLVPTTEFVAAVTTGDKFCYFSKSAANAAADTQASVGACPKVSAATATQGKILNADRTCGAVGSLNGCTAGKICVSDVCFPICAVSSKDTAQNTAAAACKCGSDFVDVATG